MSSLFSLAPIKPADTNATKYLHLGNALGKDGYDRVCKAMQKMLDELEIHQHVDRRFIQWLIVEQTDVDGQPYLEVSQRRDVFLPIAGSQYYCLTRMAEDYETSFEGLCQSLNFMMNDPRPVR